VFRLSQSARLRVRELGPGQHICSFYDLQAELIGISSEYIQCGLQRRERCLYVGDAGLLALLERELSAAYVDVDAEIRRGALILLTKEETYEKAGRFDADALQSLLRDAVEDARKAGFEGLRAAGDMTWLLDNVPGSDDVVRYEVDLNAFYAETGAIGLCLYDRALLQPRMLDAAMRTHPIVLMNDRCCGQNPYYEAPHLGFRFPSDSRAAFNERLEGIFSA